jgi:phosphohistidine swiveling domain-containing protein
MDMRPQIGPEGRGRPLIVALDHVDAGALPLVGGKAANLGELIAAGLPVPAGFCVTTEAYRDMAAAAELAEILDRLAATPAGDTGALAGLARQARERILATVMPALVADAVAAAYLALDDGVPVAVRSSATAEDLPFASFAGQQDTYLNIVGVEAVLDAVHRCWASLWTDRAVVYRVTNGINHATARLAVVVQHLVEAAVAGVMFTANPVTGRRRQAVIDATPGLGEAVVSGAVNPDHFIVDLASGAVLERRLGDKRLVIRARQGGGTEPSAQPASDTFCLTDEQIRALAVLGTQVEAHYGEPQDIEWAIDPAGSVWLTQARPITTLFPLPAAGLDDSDLRVYFCFSLAQGLHRPLTPMGLSAIRVIGASVVRLYGVRTLDPVAGPPAIRDAAGRLFLDITPIMRSAVGRALFPRILDVMEARSAAVLRSLFDDARLSVMDRSWWPFVGRIGRLAVRYGVPLLVAQALANPPAARRRLARINLELEGRMTPPDSAPAEQRLDFAVRILGDTTAPLVPRVLPAAAAGFAMLGLAGRLLGADARPGELATVLRGLPHNVTTEMDLAVWRLATRIRADTDAAEVIRRIPPAELAGRYRTQTLPPVVQRGLEEFLDRYGHRAVAEIDLGLPRWAEDPTHIIGVLANYLRLDDPDRAPDVLFARGAAQAEAMVTTLTARARRRGRVRGRAVDCALNRARQLAGVRELPKYFIVLVLARVRQQLAAVGAQLAATGRLAAAEDVFFLDLGEAAAGLRGQDLRAVVTHRRQTYERELRRGHIPRVLLSDGTEPEAATAPPMTFTDGGLVGTAASAGAVTGQARVVLDPTGAHLRPGEILVAPSTDPGWTPLFLTAGGLVMEMGGANSHGAVVAREYGIPAVVGVANATSLITTGQQLTVDGSRGLISTPTPDPTAS